MATVVASALASGSVDEVSTKLAADMKAALKGEAPALVMVFASMKQPLGELMPKLAAKLGSVPLLGASTAGEFTEKGDAKGSASLFAVAGDFRVHVGMGTQLKANAEAAIRRATEGLPKEVSGYPHRTAVVLLDALSGNAEEACMLASLALGPETRLVGGAPGDDLTMDRAQVAWGGQVAADAVIIAVIHSRKPLGIGVQHGHRRLSKALKVTKAVGNVVHTVDGLPAKDVWARETAAMGKQQGLDPADMNNPAKATPYLLRYEAGLPTGTGDTLKIRAPLSIGAGGSIAFACGMPEGVEFHITSSDLDGQVTSAREAARTAAKDLGGETCAGAVVFDCICRQTILGDRFGTAVGAISSELGNAPLAGFETYGEVAMGRGELSGFHNTTSVVLAFPR